MKKISTRRIRPAMLAAALAILTACGGSGGDAPRAQAVAADDSIAMPWNSATTLDVTSNDTIANGTARIGISTAPAHGTATVSGTSIRYAPAPGYSGADTFAYTLTVGDKSSTANVQVAVSAPATLKLAGVVRHGTLPGAQVVATIDGVAQPAVTADADGKFSVEFANAAPAAFVSLKASGVAAQSAIVLESLVGDVAHLRAVAGADGAIAANALGAANINEVTTAEAALGAQVLGHDIASQADMAAVTGRFEPSQTIDMAVVIRLVADSGVALPSGAADTLSLVSNPALFASFDATVSNTFSLFGPKYTAAQLALVNDANLGVAPPRPAPGAADVVMVLTSGRGMAMKLTLRADGTASIARKQVQTAKWTTDGTQLLLTYDTPVVSTISVPLSENDIESATQTERGLEVRALGAATATQSSFGSYTFDGGPRKGQTQDMSPTWVTLTLVAAPQPLNAADFAAGTRWAGVLTTDFSVADEFAVNQDVLRVVDATHVRYERTGVTGTWELRDGSLVVTTDGGGVFMYTLLFTGRWGESHWLTTALVGGVSTWQFDERLVKAGADLAFTPANLPDVYQVNPGAPPLSQGFDILLGDGTGCQSSLPSCDTRNVTWTIGADGSATWTNWWCGDWVNGVETCSAQSIAAFTSVGAQYGIQRTWTLSGTSGNLVYEMEHVAYLGATFESYQLGILMKSN